MTKNRTPTPVYLDPGMHPGLEVKGLMAMKNQTSARLLLVTTTSLPLPQLATLVPFFILHLTMEAQSCQQCLPPFFLAPAQHQQHSKSVGYEDSCHH